jgi:hypothetical protein
MTIVIASHYVLFAAMSGSAHTVVVEAVAVPVCVWLRRSVFEMVRPCSIGSAHPRSL